MAANCVWTKYVKSVLRIETEVERHRRQSPVKPTRQEDHWKFIPELLYSRREVTSRECNI